MVIVAVAVAVGALILTTPPGTTTLAAAVEEYVSGLEIGGTSYGITRQTDSAAEIIVYLEIIENGNTQKVPIENLLLQKNSMGNWEITSATTIVAPPPTGQMDEWQGDETATAMIRGAVDNFMLENVLENVISPTEGSLLLYKGGNYSGFTRRIYGQRGDVVLVQVVITYRPYHEGEGNITAEECWASVDKNTYRVVEWESPNE